MLVHFKKSIFAATASPSRCKGFCCSDCLCLPSSARWILQRAHAERDSAANSRQKSQLQLQQLQRQTESGRLQLQQLQRQQLALQSEETLCRRQLRSLVNGEQQLLLTTSHKSCSTRNRSTVPLFSERALSLGSSCRAGANRTASAEPSSRRIGSGSAPPQSIATSAASLLNERGNTGSTSFQALSSLEELLQHHSMLSLSPSLKNWNPESAAAAEEVEMATESLHNKGCSFWVQLEENAGL